MNQILIIILAVLVVACTGPEKFDATNQETINKSAHKIAHSLPKEKRAELGRALLYFSAQPEGNLEEIRFQENHMAPTFSAELTSDALPARNLQALNGLTGEEIIQEYKKQMQLEESRLQNKS